MKRLDLHHIKNWVRNLKTKYIVIGFIVLGVLSFILDQKKNDIPAPVDPTSVDTYIPEGMTLIPIEIQNIEALKNILGDFGVVDLYLPSFEENRAPKKIASGIKIMRAPLNPDVFAVLVLEENAPQIAQHPGAFFVTVLNPKTQKTRFNKDKKQLRTQIVTEI
ncbi:MAG: hypothetical protein V4596_12785 [Bdellovibrionota bacterium]